MGDTRQTRVKTKLEELALLKKEGKTAGEEQKASSEELGD